MDSKVLVPGQVLSPDVPHIFGPGAHVYDKKLTASLAGFASNGIKTKSGQAISTAVTRTNKAVLPEVGSIILGKTTRTNTRQATISILAIGMTGEHVCRDAFPGLIRQQDIRATEIDKVKVAESFKVGDVVRAIVISLGDERSYYLSTAKNELGVLMATTEMGNQMHPISWKEFQDPITGMKEPRKVAKPV